jgi:pimeloyl-ACP methyl ester carboxylesterase
VMPTLKLPVMLPGQLPGEVHIEEPLADQPDPAPVFTPADNPVASFAAVACSDTLNPSGGDAWSDSARAAELASPYFGRAWTWSGVHCAAWPLRDRNAYRASIGARLSGPMLVIGTRYDPATPYDSAVLTAQRYPGSRLLTVEGYGHTSSAMPSACVSAAVSAYLVERRLPGVTTCGQDEAPFSS